MSSVGSRSITIAGRRRSRFFAMTAASMLFVSNLSFAQSRAPTQAESQKGRELAAQMVARFQDLLSRHTTVVRRSNAPDDIPRGEVLSVFFTTLSREAPTDDVAFRQFTIDRFGATESDTEVLRHALRDPGDAATGPNAADICSRVLDGTLPDGMSIAKYVARVDEQENAYYEARYGAVIDELSPVARANLLQSVDAQAANTTHGTLDSIGMASDDPDLYAAMMKGACMAKSEKSSVSARDASAPTQRRGQSIRVYATYYAIGEKRFDSLEALRAYLEGSSPDVYSGIDLMECSARARANEVAAMKAELDREYIRRLRQTDPTRGLNYGATRNSPRECAW